MPEQPAQEASKPEEQKLSPAELKKKAKAEKQARRAAQKEETATAGPSHSGTPVANGNGEQRQQDGAVAPPRQTQKQQRSQQSQSEQSGQARNSQRAIGAQHAQMPTRRRNSQSNPVKEQPKKVKKEQKQVDLFSHLYTQPRKQNFEGISKDVHPAVLAVGLQISSYAICGSTARCVAMLLAFKEAIQAYTTPAGTSLARHMTSHYLSPQIDFLKSCRPISESMGNAIRFLKKKIIDIDPSVEDHVAKSELCDEIDLFLRDRITVTDRAIADTASKQIKNGSVVLTYAKSSLAEKSILQAHASGTDFRVIVADSRPLFEGKTLARSLMRAGVRVEYVPLSGVAHAVREVSLVLLGAHSMLSNGRLLSRIGTAAVAMHAFKADVPVIVCCESIKFSGKVALDSIVLNEVAPSEELLLSTPASQDTTPPQSNEEEMTTERTLNDWREISNLQVLNLMYDITPAEYIRMVICEHGSLPPSSVPVVHRLANEGE